MSYCGYEAFHFLEWFYGRMIDLELGKMTLNELVDVLNVMNCEGRTCRSWRWNYVWDLQHMEKKDDIKIIMSGVKRRLDREIELKKTDWCKELVSKEFKERFERVNNKKCWWN